MRHLGCRLNRQRVVDALAHDIPDPIRRHQHFARLRYLHLIIPIPDRHLQVRRAHRQLISARGQFHALQDRFGRPRGRHIPGHHQRLQQRTPIANHFHVLTFPHSTKIHPPAAEQNMPVRVK